MTRLIDEEETFKVLSAYYKQRTPVQDWALHDALSRVPTADTDLSDYSDRLYKLAYERGKAETVKRGHWIETEEYHGFDNEVRNKALSCSVCRVAFRISDYAQIEDFKFCPNCGADMRGEE